MTISKPHDSGSVEGKLPGIVGPTASGKERAALSTAEALGAEIVSLDSMKIYRGMDIGTAKPDTEARRRVPHHMIDVADAGETFDMKRYVEAVDGLVPRIRDRGRVPLLSGGTPMYLQALLYGLFEGPGRDASIRDRLLGEASDLGVAALHRRLQGIDPEAARRIHPNDLRRIVRALEVHEKTGRPISSFQTEFGRPSRRYRAILVGIRRERADLHARIDRRVDRMIADGLVGEVEGLWRRGALRGAAAQALGYKEVVEHLEGRATLPEAVERIRFATHRFARRQMTWLRRFRDIRWIDVERGGGEEAVATRVLEQLRRGLDESE
jgi:tRNA dimethylallyltransferase